MSDKKIYGYIRRLDLDGQIRIRQKDDLRSPIVFEGLIDQSQIKLLKQAFYEVCPISASLKNDKLFDIKLEKEEDFSTESSIKYII